MHCVRACVRAGVLGWAAGQQLLSLVAFLRGKTFALALDNLGVEWHGRKFVARRRDWAAFRGARAGGKVAVAAAGFSFAVLRRSLRRHVPWWCVAAQRRRQYGFL